MLVTGQGRFNKRDGHSRIGAGPPTYMSAGVAGLQARLVRGFMCLIRHLDVSLCHL